MRRTFTAMIGLVNGCEVVAVVKTGGLAPAEVTRPAPEAAAAPVLHGAVDSVCAMACSSAGEMPSVQLLPLLPEDCTSSIFLHAHTQPPTHFTSLYAGYFILDDTVHIIWYGIVEFNVPLDTV